MITNMITQRMEIEVNPTNNIEIRAFMNATTAFLLSAPKGKDHQTFTFIINMDHFQNDK